MRHLVILIAVGLIAGCGLVTDHIMVDYHVQENVNQFEGAGNVAIKVKVVDLRTEKEVGKKGDEYEMLGSIIADNDLKEIISQAIDTELTNRGFKSGERVLVEAELHKFYSFYRGSKVFAEMFLTCEG